MPFISSQINMIKENIIKDIIYLVKVIYNRKYGEPNLNEENYLLYLHDVTERELTIPVVVYGGIEEQEVSFIEIVDDTIVVSATTYEFRGHELTMDTLEKITSFLTEIYRKK